MKVRAGTESVTWRAKRRWTARAVVAAGVLLATLALSPTGATAHTPHDVVVDLATSPRFATDRTVYSIVREYLLKSTDGGTTWRRLQNGLDSKSQLSSVEVSRQDPARIFVGTRGDGVFRSDDAGARWRRVNTGLDKASSVRFLWMSPTDHDVLYAAGPTSGLHVTTDGGETWTPVRGFAERSVQAMAFVEGEPDRVIAGVTGEVLHSEDAGATWSSLGKPGTGQVTALATVAGEVPTVLAGTDAGLYRQRSGGEFEAIDDDIDDENITSIVADGDDVVAVSWTEGPYLSADGGDSWELADGDLTTTTMAADLGHPDFNLVVRADGPGNVRTTFLGGYDGLFRSSDPSEGWEEVTTQDAMNITALAVSPAYADDGTIVVTTYVNGPKLSTDRGATWTSLTPGIAFEYDYLRSPDYYVRLTGTLFAPDYATTNRMYATSRGFLFSSDDRATPWTPRVQDVLLRPEDPPADYLLPAFSPNYAEDRTLLAGTDSGLILRKVGDGDFVQVGDIGEEVTAFAPSPAFGDDDTVFAATPKGLFAGTLEGGLKLQETSPKDIISLAVSPALTEDGTIYLGTKRGLYVSKDRGTSWDEVPWTSSVRRPYVEAVVVSPSFGDDGFVLVSERGKGLFRSTDGGASFEATGQDLLDRNVVLASFYHPTGEPIAFSPDFANDRTIFGTAEGGLYRSTDAGETWTALEIPRETHPLTAESAPNELLRTPKGAEEGHEGHGAGPAGRSGQASSSGTWLLLTPKRVLLSLAAAIAVVVALSLAGVGKKVRPGVLVMASRVACGLAVLLVALFVLGRRI